MLHYLRETWTAILAGKINSKFVRYAIGELTLVVFGILIALQINNWNEERKEQKQITEYAHALIYDLERDLAMAQIIKAEIDLLTKKIDHLASYVDGKSVDQLNNIDLFYLMRKPFYRPFSWNRTALDQIKSSGGLRQMKNQQLAEKIAAYEAFTHHLDDDFEFDRAVGNNALDLARQVIDLNYLQIQDIFPAGMLEVFDFPNVKLHQAYGDANLRLLTDDIRDVKAAVNAYLILGNAPGIRPRAEIEMPKLVSSAQNLIALLKKEYTKG
jgi:hypothetical protein